MIEDNLLVISAKLRNINPNSDLDTAIFVHSQGYVHKCLCSGKMVHKDLKSRGIYITSESKIIEAPVLALQIPSNCNLKAVRHKQCLPTFLVCGVLMIS